MMEYTATLMKDNRVKISIVKDGFIDIQRIKKMVDKKTIKLESYKELKTRIIVYSEPIKNYRKAIPNYPQLFIAGYNIIGLGLSVEGLKEVQKFLDDNAKELESD